MKKSNPVYGLINVGAFLLLCSLIVISSGSAAIIPVTTLGCGAFGALVQRDSDIDEKFVAAFAAIGLIASLLWFFFGV